MRNRRYIKYLLSFKCNIFWDLGSLFIYCDPQSPMTVTIIVQSIVQNPVYISNMCCHPTLIFGRGILGLQIIHSCKTYEGFYSYYYLTIIDLFTKGMFATYFRCWLHVVGKSAQVLSQINEGCIFTISKLNAR